MSNFIKEFARAAKRTPRMYFAPLVGAFQAVKCELRVEPSDGKAALIKTKRRMHKSFQERPQDSGEKQRHELDAA